MQGYTDTILKYAADETHVGLLKNPDGTGEVGLNGQDVGKRLAVRFTLNISSNQVQDIRFQVFGPSTWTRTICSLVENNRLPTC